MRLNEIETITDLEYILWRAIKTHAIKRVFGANRAGCSLKKIIMLDESGERAELVPAYEFEPTVQDEEIERLFFHTWLRLLHKKDRSLVIKRCQGMTWEQLIAPHQNADKDIQHRYHLSMEKILRYLRTHTDTAYAVQS